MYNLNPSGYGIGLALGGGGARGLAHIGLLEVLQREAIPVCAIAGTSMGGLIGALYAAGIGPARMTDIALHLGKTKEFLRLIDLLPSQQGFVKGRRIYDALAQELGPERSFTDLKVPFAVVASDFHTGKEVVIEDGLLVDAIRATISVPGVFAPVARGEHLLLDGGVLNNVPVDLARRLGACKILAVDVMPYFDGLHRVESLPEPLPYTRLAPAALRNLWQVILIMISTQTQARLTAAPPDLLIRPAVPGDIGLLSGFDRALEIIRAGREAAEAVLPQIREILK
jgi:NTE family protein